MPSMSCKVLDTVNVAYSIGVPLIITNPVGISFIFITVLVAALITLSRVPYASVYEAVTVIVYPISS